MKSRRPRSTSNAAHNPSHRGKQRAASPQKPVPAVPPLIKPQPGTGMTPASRYAQNLKVLRRHDPSIISIFDQFSHVCLYHHNGTKWEKKGFEGSMFLFERQAYPPYGFFILNRMGMEDYVLHMYPEDDMETHGDYLMYRTYPDFTAKRLAMAQTILTPHDTSAPSGDRFADAHGRIPSPTDVLTNWQVLPSKNRDKGRSETVGLWMFATDAREPMKTVMMRLHSYIRKVVPYPEEFRYGPDRPPPPNPHLKTGDGAAPSPAPARANVDRTASRASVQSTTSKPSPSTVNGAGSELDKLFSKLVPATSPSPTQAPRVTNMPSSTLEALFAAASSASPAPSAPTPNKGLALLDSIFASATPSTSSVSVVPSKTHQSQLSMSSSRASPFPPPPSAPPSTNFNFGSSRHDHDPQSDASSPSDLYPEPHPDIRSPKPTSTALPQILTQDVISALLGLPQSHSRASSAASSHRRYEGDVESSDNDPDDPAPRRGSAYSSDVGESLPSVVLPTEGHRAAPGQHVLGDVTPRPPQRAFGASPALPLAASSSTSTITGVSFASISSSTASTLSAPSPSPSAPPNNPRTLVPFHAESTLWPYPRAPVDDRDGDVVVLDFAETSALNDLDAFDKRRRAGKGKKGRRERELENERERQEIEKGWDVPAPSAQAEITLRAPQKAPKPATPAPAPATVPTQAKAKDGNKGKAAVNGMNGTNGTHGPPLPKSILSTSIISAVHAHTDGTPPPPTIERNAFVREVLTLIHTDKEFVDRLWEEYRARVQS